MSDGESVEYRNVVTVDSKQAVAGLDQLEGASAKSDRGLKTLDSTARRAGGGLSSFGGVCRAAAAGLAFFGVSLGVGAILHKTLEEVKSGETAFAQLAAGVKSTGGAAGYSAEQLAAYSQVLSRQTSIDDEVIQGAQRMLLTFTSIGHDVFPAATKAVLDISAVMGGDLVGASIQVGKALNDPVRGMSALRRVGVEFTDAQEKQIKALVKSGKTMEAQKLILAELNTEFGGTAVAARDTLGGALDALSNRWGDLLQTMGSGGSGPFRDVVEGVITGLETMTDNWHAFEAAIYMTLSNITEVMTEWISFWLGLVDKFVQGANAVVQHNPFASAASRQGAATVAGVTAGAVADVRDVGGALREIFDEKAEAALAKYDEQIKGLDGSTKKLARDTGVLAEANKKAADEAARLLAAARRSIAELERKASLEARLTAASSRGAAALEAEERAQAQLNAVYQIEAPLLAKGLKLKADQVRQIETATAAIYDEAKARDVLANIREAVASNRGYKLELIDQPGLDRMKASAQLLKDQRAMVRGMVDDLKGGLAVELRVSGAAEVSDRLGFIEDRYLQMVQATGQATLEEGERVLSGLLAAFGMSLDDIKRQLGQSYDIKAVASVRASLKTPFQEAEAEIKRIEALISSTASATTLTVAEGEEAIYRIRQEKMEQTLDYVTSGLGYLANLFGGFFAKLYQLAQGVQGAISFGKDVKGAASSMGATTQMASALGGIGTVIAIFAVVYDFVDKMIKAKKAISYGHDATLTIASSDHSEGYTAVSAQGFKVVQAIRDVVKQMENALGGTITDLQGLGVKIRNDGKYIASYINGVMVGHFESVDEAILAALQVALQKGQAKIAGVSALVAQGIQEFNFTNAQGVQDFLAALREISNMSLSQGAIGLQDTIRHLGDLWDTLTKMREVTPAVAEGFANLAAAEVNAWSAWRDAITGRHRSVQEELEDHKREAGLFNAQRLLRLAELQMRKLELQQELELLKARGHLLTGGGSPGGGHGGVANGPSQPHGQIHFTYENDTSGPIDAAGKQVNAAGGLVQATLQLGKLELQGKAALLQATTGLVSAELSMYEQTIALIQLQLDAIDQIIANMPGAIDIPGIRLPGGGSGAGDEKKAFRERLADIVAGGLSEAGKALYDYQKQLKDLAAEQKKNKAPAAEYQAALEAIRKQFQKGLLDRAKDLAGVAGDDFTKSLKEGLDFFAELKKMGSAKSGIPEWYRAILEGKFLEKMKNDWQQRANEFAGITNPMLAIQIQARQLGEELDALAATGKMTAAEIAAAKALIAQGVDYQRQQGINGVLDKLFAVVHESGKYAGQELALQKTKVQLEYLMIREQLRAYGVLAQYAQLVTDAENEALRLIAAGAAGGGKEQPGKWWFEGNQQFADSLKAFQDAVASFRKSTDALRTDAQLSDLSAEDRLMELRSKFADLLRRAQGGDTVAFGELEGVRRELLQQGRTAYQGGAQYSALFKYVMDRSEGLLSGATAPNPMQAVVAAISGAEGTFALHLDSGTDKTVGAIGAAAIKISDAVANDNKRLRIGHLDGGGLRGGGPRIITAAETAAVDTAVAITAMKAQLEAALVELRAIKAGSEKTAKNTGDTAVSVSNIDKRGKRDDLRPGKAVA